MDYCRFRFLYCKFRSPANLVFPEIPFSVDSLNRKSVRQLLSHSFRPCRSSERQREEKTRDGFLRRDHRCLGPRHRHRSEKSCIDKIFHSSDHAARQSGNARRKPGTGFSDAITGAWARGTGTGVKNLVSTRFFTLPASERLPEGRVFRRSRGGKRAPRCFHRYRGLSPSGGQV